MNLYDDYMACHSMYSAHQNCWLMYDSGKNFLTIHATYNIYRYNTLELQRFCYHTSCLTFLLVYTILLQDLDSNT